MRITKLLTNHLRVPLPPRGRISLDAPARSEDRPEAIDLLTAHLETDAGLTGFGFTYLLGPGAAALRSLLEDLSPLVVGEDPRDTDRLFARAEARFRGSGFLGLAPRAYAAIDIALWDLKAQSASVPLARFLGGSRLSARFFVSDAAPPGRGSSEVVKAVRPMLAQGAAGVRIEIGSGDVQADADRVREIAEGLGEEASVQVAAEGRFDLGTALALAHFFEDQGVDLFEDPIPASDVLGYAKLAATKEIPLAVGSSFAHREDFFRVIWAGDVRTVRPDPCRLGGITPIVKIAAVAEAFQVAVSSVRMPEVGVHLACGLAAVSSADYVAWFKDVLAGGPRMEGGQLVPPASPGLGVALADGALAKYGIS